MPLMLISNFITIIALTIASAIYRQIKPKLNFIETKRDNKIPTVFDQYPKNTVQFTVGIPRLHIHSLQKVPFLLYPTLHLHLLSVHRLRCRGETERKRPPCHDKQSPFLSCILWVPLVSIFMRIARKLLSPCAIASESIILPTAGNYNSLGSRTCREVCQYGFVYLVQSWGWSTHFLHRSIPLPPFPENWG